MRRWTKHVRALDLFGEKNRLGRSSNLGQAGQSGNSIVIKEGLTEGNLCLWGPERFFSIVLRLGTPSGGNAKYTYPLFGRAFNSNLTEDDLISPLAL